MSELPAMEQAQADRAAINKSLVDHHKVLSSTAKTLMGFADAGVVSNATLLAGVSGLYSAHASLVILVAGLNGFVLTGFDDDDA